jgi:S-adenosylmethionine decarboxylase
MVTKQKGCMSLVGVEWQIDALGCSAALVAEIKTPRLVCERILAELALRVIGAGHWHQFPEPGGVTGLYLLTESHLACHTYPEHQIVTFNLYCCRERPAWPWEDRLREMLSATKVVVRQQYRGRIE